MPKYYNLPEYDERRRLQQELRQNVDKTIPGYEAYAKAMEALDKKMAEEAKKLQEKGNNGPVPGL